MAAKMNLKKISSILQALLYTLAGINHFINVDLYISMSPQFIPAMSYLNLVVGIIEIGLGLAILLLPRYRNWVVGCIILMLIAFFPIHIYHVVMNGIIPNTGFTMPIWAAWIRLFFQFIFIYWAYSIRKS